MALTPKQRKVVEATKGHIVVLAGPGCGKTHVITEKIIYLFEKDAIPEPHGLLAVTFTNAAARVMRARLHSKGFNQWSRVWIGTFHSFGRFVLSCYGSDIKVQEDFEILDPERRPSLLKQLADEFPIDYSPSDLGSMFDAYKRMGRYPGRGDELLPQEVRPVYEKYNEVLQSQNTLDFGDLVALAVQLLKESDFVLRLFRGFFRYVMVDEFQDTDSQQLEMIRILAEPAIGSTVVGDDDQSIFGWRGALRENMVNIRKLLGSEEIALGQNFRSDAVIVEAAAKVIGVDPERQEKKIRPVSSERGHLYHQVFEEPREEAMRIAEWIKEILTTEVVEDPGDVAIIARTRPRMKWIIETMDRVGIPWFDRSRLNFEDSWETTLGLAIIELAHDPDSSLYLHRAMAGVEEGGLAFRLGERDALDVALTIRDRLKKTSDLVLTPERLADILESGGLTELIKESSTGPSDIARRLRNLDSMVRDIATEAGRLESGLLEVVSRISGCKAVQVRSGHQAKGCEFEIVFFAGLEDDVLPDYRSHDKDDRLAEERRVFYVGLTRARKTAYLTCVTQRPDSYGRVWETIPSRFIGHIPDHYFSQIESRRTT